MKRYHQLSAGEQAVIHHHGTERPGTGAYYLHQEPGVFTCKRCDAPLYLSDHKFSAHCGWPSFDEEIPGAIIKRLDADGVRVEIACQRCEAHLGHVFLGEGYTPKQTRHCVNSIALAFVPAKTKEGYDRAIVAGGCFWGIEYLMQAQAGVITSAVGYTGGMVTYPSYQEVCTGTTGHAEAVELIYNPKIIDYAQIIKYFLEIHDPTQYHQQGPDIGSQYRSAIFYLTSAQQSTAQALMRALEEKGMAIATELLPAGPFYHAEEYHQNYYKKNHQSPYCHRHTPRFF